MILHDHPNEVLGTLTRVVMSSHLRTFIKHGLEKNIIGFQLLFTRLANLRIDQAPHRGHNETVLQRLISTQFAKHVEVAAGDASHPWIGNTMEVENSTQGNAPFVPMSDKC